MASQASFGPLRNIVRPLKHYNLINESIAKRVVERIGPIDSTLIVPYSDYPGILTKTLLGSKFKKLLLGVVNKSAKSELEHYIETSKLRHKVEILQHDILAKSYNVLCDDDQDLIKKSLSGCCFEKDWKNLTTNKIIVPLLRCKTEASLFTSLFYQMAHRNGLHVNGRTEFYIFLSGRQYLYLNAKPSVNLNHYRGSSILCKTVFDLHLLDSMNLKDAFDISLKRIQNTQLAADHPRSDAYNQVHLVKLTPKPDVFERFSPNTLLEYRFLVRQCMQSRTAYIILFMERWFPNCRGDLLNLGFNESQRFGDVSCDDLLRLYSYVSSRPDYYTSTLHAAASSIEGTIEELEEARMII